jgi:hypothetical protein
MTFTVPLITQGCRTLQYTGKMYTGKRYRATVLSLYALCPHRRTHRPCVFDRPNPPPPPPRHLLFKWGGGGLVLNLSLTRCLSVLWCGLWYVSTAAVVFWSTEWKTVIESRGFGVAKFWKRVKNKILWIILAKLKVIIQGSLFID